MPARTRRTREQLYADRLDSMTHSTLIGHIATAPSMIERPLSEMTDESGEPTFAFMKAIHDAYFVLARRHRSLVVRREWIMGYEMFAKAVLKRREGVRNDYAGFFFSPDVGPEHPWVTELYKVHQSGSSQSLQSAADSIVVRNSA